MTITQIITTVFVSHIIFYLPLIFLINRAFVRQIQNQVTLNNLMNDRIDGIEERIIRLEKREG